MFVSFFYNTFYRGCSTSVWNVVIIEYIEVKVWDIIDGSEKQINRCFDLVHITVEYRLRVSYIDQALTLCAGYAFKIAASINILTHIIFCHIINDIW